MVKKTKLSKISLGEIIRIHRKLKGFTQEKLSEKLNISFQQIQKYEHNINKPSVEITRRLCEVLEIPIETIFGDNKEDLYSKAKTEIIKDFQFVKMLKASPELFELVTFYHNNKKDLGKLNLLELLKNLVEVPLSKRKHVLNLLKMLK